MGERKGQTVGETKGQKRDKKIHFIAASVPST